MNKLTQGILLSLFVHSLAQGSVDFEELQAQYCSRPDQTYQLGDVYSLQTGLLVERGRSLIYQNQDGSSPIFDFQSELSLDPKNCIRVHQDHEAFYITEAAPTKNSAEPGLENLRTSGSFDKSGKNIQSLIPNFSLVRLLNESRAQRVGQSSYLEIEVIAPQVNETSAQRITEAGETGFIYGRSLRDVSQYYFKVTAVGSILPQIPGSEESMQGKLLALSQKGGETEMQFCEETSEALLVFQVFNEDDTALCRPIGEIAVSSSALSTLLVGAQLEVLDKTQIKFTDEVKLLGGE